VTVRKPFVAGNWKLHKGIAEARELAAAIKEADSETIDVGVAPVATALHAVAEVLAGSDVILAAQNTFHEDSGAYTGELSPELLKDVGCSACLVGHSERRTLFHETDPGVRKKTAALLAKGLMPIVCVGESLSQRDSGMTLDVVLGQVTSTLAGLEEPGSLVFAYEPIWAIGTGRTAKPEDAQQVHAAIREKLAERFDPQVARGIRILYGGSVKPDNAAELLAQPDIDGALVGGASLKAETFVPILRAAQAQVRD